MLEAKESVKGKCARRDSVEQMSIDTPTLIHPRPELQNVKRNTDVHIPTLMHNVKNLLS